MYKGAVGKPLPVEKETGSKEDEKQEVPDGEDGDEHKKENTGHQEDGQEKSQGNMKKDEDEEKAGMKQVMRKG